MNDTKGKVQMLYRREKIANHTLIAIMSTIANMVPCGQGSWTFCFFFRKKNSYLSKCRKTLMKRRVLWHNWSLPFAKAPGISQIHLFMVGTCIPAVEIISSTITTTRSYSQWRIQRGFEGFPSPPPPPPVFKYSFSWDV